MALPAVDTYWVVPGRLLAGEYPGAWNDDDARRRVKYLLDQGVTAFFDLTEADELLPYAQIVKQEAKFRGIDVSHERFPIIDHTAPTAEEAARIVNALETAIAAGKTPYVHCYAGIGRTGTIVGIWMVENRRISGASAIEEIAKLRRKVRTATWNSPEALDQIALLRNWSPPE